MGWRRTAGPFLQLICDSLDVFLLVQVRGDVVCPAFAERVKLFACLLARFGVAGGYVYVGAVLHEAFADHAADAFGSTGDEHDLALEIVSG